MLNIKSKSPGYIAYKINSKTQNEPWSAIYLIFYLFIILFILYQLINILQMFVCFLRKIKDIDPDKRAGGDNMRGFTTRHNIEQIDPALAGDF